MNVQKFVKIIIVIIGIIVFVGIMAAIGVYIKTDQPDSKQPEVSNFTECAAAGNPVMESYPRQCRHNDQLFVENIGNELEKQDLIQAQTPRPNQDIQSPVTIEGTARGYWFFEATFPVILKDENGNILVESYATAQGEWMTEDFVPFVATLEFDLAEGSEKEALLILKKANASGLPEHDDMLEIPVFIK
ncbi:MAG: Gmad2 immunoglobulin-like domain-containing protein [Patescibacteria group bacterium]